MRGFRDGRAVDRQVRLVVVTGPEADVVEAVVSVTDGKVRRLDEVVETPAGAPDRGVDAGHRRA